MSELKTINVSGLSRNYLNVNEKDFLSSKILTYDLITGLKRPDSETMNTTGQIQFINHLLNCPKLLDFIGHWECTHNPDFNIVSYVKIKNELDPNANINSINNWVKNTKAIGIKTIKGKNGGTFLHKDILQAAFSCTISCSIDFIKEELAALELEMENQPNVK